LFSVAFPISPQSKGFHRRIASVFPISKFSFLLGICLFDTESCLACTSSLLSLSLSVTLSCSECFIGNSRSQKLFAEGLPSVTPSFRDPISICRPAGSFFPRKPFPFPANLFPMFPFFVPDPHFPSINILFCFLFITVAQVPPYRTDVYLPPPFTWFAFQCPIQTCPPVTFHLLFFFWFFRTPLSPSHAVSYC